MLQSAPTRGTSTTWIGAVYEDKQRRKLVIAVVLLLAAITAVLVRDYKSSLGNDNDETAAADGGQPVSAPSAVEQAPPAAQPTMPVASKSSAKETSSHTPSSQAPGTARLASNSVKRGRAHDLGSAAPRSSATWGPATTAAERARTSDQDQARQQLPSYPLLAGAMAVRGSVLLQALIAADGTVEEMRVISGPTILVSAARQAVQRWRFKPYLLNGKAVETYARVTVNFTIDVSNTEARYHLNSVTSTGAL
ncbi:MAG: TonB family protein [Terriglobales bacterium]